MTGGLSALSVSASNVPTRNLGAHVSRNEYVDGEILVKYKKDKVNLETLSGRLKATNLTAVKSLGVKRYIKKSNLSVLSVSSSQSLDAKVAELKADPNVEYAEPNYKRYVSDIPTNDTYRDRLWGLDNTGQTIAGDQGTITGTAGADIHAVNAWNINEGTNASVIVAVIDTGVAYNHPDLAANMWDGSNCKDENGVAIVGGCNHGYDFADGDATPLPVDSSHGTHVSGTIAGVKNNSKGVVGVAPHVKIMAVRFGFDVASEVQAIDFATQNGAKVINASYGGSTFSQAEYDAINRFRAAGGIFVAAAGNDGLNNDSNHSYPSDYDLDNIISVAATDQHDALASFSNFSTTSVDVGAPGVNILSTIADSLQFVENFASTTLFSIPTNWTRGGVTTNHWGVLNYGGNKALFGDTIQFPYTKNSDTTIDSPTINLGGTTTGATISFNAMCDTEYTTTDWRDYMELEYSSDGSTFTPAQDPFYGGDFQWDEAYLNGNTGPGAASYFFSGVPIPTQDLTSNFKFRYRWVTNATNNHFAGCSVDDISVDAVGDGSDERYDYYSGTSMATPHVAGLAALLFGYQPTLTAAQVRSTILSSGDSLSSLAGKTVTGKRINAANALLAVDPVKQITSFAFASPAATGTISESGKTITFTVPHGTTVTALIPTIAINGATVSPASGVAEDFTSPVVYTVTAHDGSTQAYTVTVTVAPSSDANIISFASTSPASTGQITATSVSLTLPYGTSLTNLPISITLSDGATVSPASSTISFVDGVPMTFVVTAQDATTTQAYVVTVHVNPPSDLTVLTAAISSAQTLHDAAVEGTVPGQYASGTKLILQTAINAAAALTNATIQSVVDQMVTTLNQAVTTFNASLIPPSNMTILAADIATAQALHDAAVEGTSPGQFATGTKVILQSAIDSARVLTSTSSQSVVDQMVTTLDQAVTAFQNGMVDNVPPVITLLGDSTVTINFGSVYTDAGATAHDNLEGDITSRIVTINSVNTSSPGTYSVVYNVSDLEGNSAQAVRMVAVNHQAVVNNGGGGGGGGGGGSSGGGSSGGGSSHITSVVSTVIATSTTSIVQTQNQTIVPVVSDQSKTITNVTSGSIKVNNNQSTSYTFYRTLSLGMSGPDVFVLQKFLNSHGFIIATSGPGSKGKENTYFGLKTQKAVKAFQKAQGISAIGVVGPMTQKSIESKNK